MTEPLQVAKRAPLAVSKTWTRAGSVDTCTVSPFCPSIDTTYEVPDLQIGAIMRPGSFGC